MDEFGPDQQDGIRRKNLLDFLTAEI